jgi:uncharacterized protein (TIGR02996 family)
VTVRRYEGRERGNKRFWEISISGKTTITVDGIIGRKGKTEKLTWYDAANAKTEYDRMIASHLAKKYVLVSETASEQLKKSAESKTKSEGDFETNIRQNPDDAAAWLVYADWLTEQGDPRGELIVVQEARARKPKDNALKRREDALMDNHYDVFVGADLSEMIEESNLEYWERGQDERKLAVTWRNGFFDEAWLNQRIEWADDDDAEDARIVGQDEFNNDLKKVLAHPSALFLQSLHISVSRAYRRFGYSSVIKIIAEQKPAPPLRQLTVGDKKNPDLCSLGDIEDLLVTYPSLKSLTLHGRCTLTESSATFPQSLEHLFISSPSESITSAVKRSKLKRASVWGP